jgi:hypothetical protein
VKFSRDDIVVITDPNSGFTGRRARVLGQAVHYGGEPRPGWINVAFDDGKPYRTLAEEQLEQAPVIPVGTERFTCGPDDSGSSYWLNGDEGSNLLVDEFNTDRYGYIIDARVGGRTFIRDEWDVAERTFIEVA